MAHKASDTKPLITFEPDEATPLDIYSPTHRNILAMMAESGKREKSRSRAEAIEDDHAVAASLPVDYSVVDQKGHMEHHGKPIISIHGKDVDERELDKKNAA